MLRDLPTNIKLLVISILYLFITVKVIEFATTRLPERFGDTFVYLIIAEAMIVGAMFALFIILAIKTFKK